MSIIEQEAEKLYPDLVFPGYPREQKHFQQVYTSDDLQEAYMQGADREPTDAEVEAAAKQLYRMDCNAAGLFIGLDWNALHVANKADYRIRARKALEAARAKAVEES